MFPKSHTKEVIRIPPHVGQGKGGSCGPELLGRRTPTQSPHLEEVHKFGEIALRGSRDLDLFVLRLLSSQCLPSLWIQCQIGQMSVPSPPHTLVFTYCTPVGRVCRIVQCIYIS